MNQAMPLPCAECETFLSTVSDKTRPQLETLRDYLNTRRIADGQPHQHVGAARAEDLDACMAALDKEMADRKRVHGLLGKVHELVQVELEDDQETFSECMARLTRGGDSITGGMISRLLNEAIAIEESRTNYMGGLPAISRRVA